MSVTWLKIKPRDTARFQGGQPWAKSQFRTDDPDGLWPRGSSAPPGGGNHQASREQRKEGGRGQLIGRWMICLLGHLGKKDIFQCFVILIDLGPCCQKVVQIPKFWRLHSFRPSQVKIFRKWLEKNRKEIKAEQYRSIVKQTMLLAAAQMEARRCFLIWGLALPKPGNE